MSFNPAHHNFTIYEGTTFRQRITWLTGGLGSPPKDLSGYTAECEIKDNQGGDVVFYTLQSSDNSIILGGSNGTIELLIPASVTDTFSWDIGFYNLNVTAPLGGDTDLILLGTFVVIQL